MPRKVFYSFHYQADSWRASMVRNIGTVEGNPPASDNSWEEVVRAGEASIRRWIDAELAGRACTVVLVGAETARRPWVNYEIDKSWSDRKGLFGVRIHRLMDSNRQISAPGDNPFQRHVLPGGRSLATAVQVYDPPYYISSDVYNYISDNLAGWIERAIGDR